MIEVFENNELNMLLINHRRGTSRLLDKFIFVFASKVRKE